MASEPAFVVLKLAGAAYLIYLGGHSVYTAIRVQHEVRPAARADARPEFRQGLLSNLGNPKMAVFFSSLLPQFADTFTGLLALGLTFCLLTLAWLSGYAFVLERAGDVLRRPRVRRAVDALMGTALIAFGARLATWHR